MSELFSYGGIKKIKEANVAVKLLSAENAPLIISFFHRSFIQENHRSLSHNDLVSELDNFLFYLRSIYGADLYPKAAKDYINDWAAAGYIRKYYVRGKDDPDVDLMPSSEKVMEWIKGLETKRFVGTESRLMTVFQLLNDIVYRSETDPEIRIAELEKQRNSIGIEIEKIKQGKMDTYDSTQILERFMQAEETASKLLGDFRQVEENFRFLDMATREKIAVSELGKGKLLDEVFKEQDTIKDSDEGKSFRSFWEFLMSSDRQEELDRLLNAVFKLDEIGKISPDNILQSIRYLLLGAGEKVYVTNNALTEQLRKFLDDQVFLENKRIIEIVKNIEKTAVEIKQRHPKDKSFAELDAVKPEINLLMSRNLFTPPSRPTISSEPVVAGDADVDLTLLYNQEYVDESRLKGNVKDMLRNESQVSLRHILEKYPLQKGITELITYMSIAHESDKAMVSKEVEIIEWKTESGNIKRAKYPQIIFVR